MSPAPYPPAGERSATSGPLDIFVSWWAGQDTRRSRILFVLLLLICAAVALLGVPRVRIYGSDVFVPLDGAWRVLNGQRPVVDFYAQMGPAYYLLYAAGLWLAGNNARGLSYGSTLTAALIAFWAFYLLRTRMKPAPLFVACLFLTLLAAAPFPLGTHPRQSGFAMTYNRQGFALAALVLLESFLPADTAGRRPLFAGAFSTGLACGLALFLKVSYGLVALTFAAVSLPFRTGARIRLAGMAVGFIAFSVPMMAWLRFDLAALVREYGLLGRVKSGQLGLFTVLQSLYRDRLEIALVVLLAVLVTLLPGVPLRRGIALFLATGMAALASTLLMVTNNAQAYGLPLLASAVLLLLNEATATAKRGSPSPHLAPLLAVALLVVGIPMGLDAAGLAAALEDKMLHSEPGYRLTAEHLASIEFVDCPGAAFGTGCSPSDNGEILVRSIEEGIALVEANSHAGESVRGMSMSNPFSYATLRPPSRGGAVVFAMSDVSEAVVPPKELLLGDVALLLIRKLPFTEGPDALASIVHRYPELLSEEYMPVAESPNWTLYRHVR